MVVFGQSGCVRAKWLSSGKLVEFGQNWLYLDKVVAFGQSGCSLAKVVFVQSAFIPVKLL